MGKNDVELIKNTGGNPIYSFMYDCKTLFLYQQCLLYALKSMPRDGPPLFDQAVVSQVATNASMQRSSWESGALALGTTVGFIK